MEKLNQRILLAAGVINGFFFVSHALFYTMFGWEKSLSGLNHFDWAVFFTYHVIVMLTIATMAIFSVCYPRQLTQTALGRATLVFFILFYLSRIVSEFLFFGYDGVRSLFIIFLCLLPMIADTVGFFIGRRAGQDA